MDIPQPTYPVFFTENETIAEVAERLKRAGLMICGTFDGRIMAAAIPEKTLDDKRREAKALMGNKLIASAGYVPTPKHSVHLHVYGGERDKKIARIKEAAAADRRRNPVACANAHGVRP